MFGLGQIIIQKSDTNTQKKLRNIYENDFKSNKTMNLIGN